MGAVRLGIFWLAAMATVGCARPSSSTPASRNDEQGVHEPTVGSSSPLASAPSTSGAFEAPPPPAHAVPTAKTAFPAPLPADVTPGVEVVLRVPSDRRAIVVHAPAGNRQAIVYLHGVCGDVFATRSWAAAASQLGTLVALLGDEPCKGRRGRFRWFSNPERLDRRIRRALQTVKQARGGQLEIERLTLIGYSQGADRAERLASRFPRRYPRVLLGSPPHAPKPASFTSGQAIAIVAGALEQNEGRERGAKELEQAGFPVRFSTLPGAHHGQFGPEGHRVMCEALAFLFEHAPVSSQRRGGVAGDGVVSGAFSARATPLSSDGRGRAP